MDIRDVERRVFDLIASSVIRVIPVSTWKANGKDVVLPYRSDITPDTLSIFRTEVNVPSSPYKWFLKLLLSGNARIIVDGSKSFGYDEAHTYIPIEPGVHSIEVIASPRTMFGFHRWSLSFDYALLVEVVWDVMAIGLKLLQIVDFIHNLPRDDALRSELESLLTSAMINTRIAPSLTQITTSLMFLYESPLSAIFRRGDLRNPYGEYVWLSGVYGVGVLKGYLEDIPKTTIDETISESHRIWNIVEKGLEKLREKYPKIGTIFATGHSHIDAEWLWPRNETIEKVLRTFSTIVELMKEYKDFTYIQSSAQYYKWVEERNPKLFQEIKRLVDEGRWIIAGGMWIESDTQLIDGESLVRQFLYGQRYFMNRFGRISRIGWLPDSFGFSGNLPQIMRKSGIEVFITHKVMWNDTNEFPLHSFIWKGVDGSEIPVQILINGYNEMMTPRSLHTNWMRYKNKDIPFIPYSYGYGDGGGGPTREMLEYIDLNNKLPRIPMIKHLNEDEYLKNIKSVEKSLGVWEGELYVEVHRGTYTTNLKMKELMAKAEILVKELEIWNTIANVYGFKSLPKEDIESLWKTVLFNQFHDILPGSSIREVYENAYRDLDNVIKTSNNAINNILTDIGKHAAKQRSLAVFNVLPWSRRGIIPIPKDLNIDGVECQETVDSKYVYVETPPTGFKLYSLGNRCLEPRDGVIVRELPDGIELENEYIIIRIDSNGNISSIKLRDGNIEILKSQSNRLVAHIDRPGIFDAWDIRDDFLYQGIDMNILEKPRIVVKGPLVSCVEYVKGYKNSRIRQKLCLYKGSPVIEISNRIIWNDKGLLIKVWFDTNINSDKAVFDIPYGAIERSTRFETSIEKARFEVPALRWMDLSDGEKGIAIISPSRHGYSVVKNRIGLSLLRSPTFPNPWSDLGEFETTYYIYPHRGDYVNAEVPKIAYELMYSLRPIYIDGGEGREIPYSYIKVNPPKSLIGTLKIAEDGDGYILRIYNPYNTAIKISIEMFKTPKQVMETNIIETLVGSSIDINNIELKPFEIKTLKIFY